MVKGGVDNRSFRRKRRGKKVFHGNQHTKKLKMIEEDVDMVTVDVSSGEFSGAGSTSRTVSEAKLQNKLPDLVDVVKEKIQGLRFMDMELLSAVFELLPCPECKQPMLELLEMKRYGLGCELIIHCQGCTWEHKFLNTKKTGPSFQVNRKAFYAMRRVGGGYQSLKKFLYLMDHPPPMTEKNYRKLTNVYNSKIKQVAETVMTEAAVELHKTDDIIADIGVSLDGTWQKRGFTSLNGAVAAISLDTGRIVDVDIMSRYCQGCVNKKAAINVNKVQSKTTSHVCTINHEGSAPKMEQSGVVRIFDRSIEKHKLRYSDYYGDGDTKSFSAVKDTYDGMTVKKKECIGHVQKRVGKRLRR